MSESRVFNGRVEAVRAKIERIGGRLRLSDDNLRGAAEDLVQASPEEREDILRDLVALAMLGQDVVGDGAALLIAQLMMLAGTVLEDPVAVRNQFRAQGLYLDAAARVLGQAQDLTPTEGDAVSEDSLFALRLRGPKKQK